ncbi:MAG: tetratricopeptide repeat protein [Deltaproteobacteria bacterium]|nr:tetratricopeptide repeat protein [Deltaproteobacteria bacterium]MBZ0219744.1 tetratricopeptide repeat protein [Deltaproteobacteria bacterium]
MKKCSSGAAAIAALVFFLASLFPGVPEDARAGSNKYFTDVGQFNYSRFLMDEGDYDGALRELGRFIENFPGSPLIPEAQFSMAEAYMRAGRYNEAESQWKLYISNFPESPFAIVAEIKMTEAVEKLKRPSPPARPGPVLREKRPGLRAVQVMRFEGMTFAEVDKEMAALKASGIDTVILRVFHNSGDRYYPAASPSGKQGVYFETEHAPVVDDILPRLTELARANGLKVFAWMTTRYADYGIEDDEGLACVSYDLPARAYARCKGLDLFNEAAVERLERIYSDLALNDIDGVLFQDDMVFKHNEGLGPHAAALFRKDFGAELVPEELYARVPGSEAVHYTPLFWKWATWKNRRLLDVAGRLKEAVRKRRPGTAFAINLMYESVTNPPYALAWLSQDLSAALRADFDYFSIMAYHRQMGEELEKTEGEIREMIAKMAEDAIKTVGDPARVLMKLQTVDWKTGGPISDSEVVELIRDMKGKDVSLAVVPYRGDFPFRELSSGRVAALEGDYFGTGSVQ